MTDLTSSVAVIDRCDFHCTSRGYLGTRLRDPLSGVWGPMIQLEGEDHDEIIVPDRQDLRANGGPSVELLRNLGDGAEEVDGERHHPGGIRGDDFTQRLTERNEPVLGGHGDSSSSVDVTSPLKHRSTDSAVDSQEVGRE